MLLLLVVLLLFFAAGCDLSAGGSRIQPRHRAPLSRSLALSSLLELLAAWFVCARTSPRSALFSVPTATLASAALLQQHEHHCCRYCYAAGVSLATTRGCHCCKRIFLPLTSCGWPSGCLANCLLHLASGCAALAIRPAGGGCAAAGRAYSSEDCLTDEDWRAGDSAAGSHEGWAGRGGDCRCHCEGRSEA